MNDSKSWRDVLEKIVDGYNTMEKEEPAQKKKKVVIICSLSCKDTCEEAAKLFEDLGMDVVSPLKVQNDSLYFLQIRYLKEIESADLVVAIPKICSPLSELPGRTVVTSEFGESTSYELAYANHIGKRIIFWGQVSKIIASNRFVVFEELSK